MRPRRGGCPRASRGQPAPSAAGDHGGPRRGDDPRGGRPGNGRRGDVGARRRCRWAHGPNRRRPRHPAGARGLDVRTTALVSGWRRHPIDTPAPGPEIVRTGRPIFIETRRELLARFPLVKKIEKDQRFGGFAGVPVPLGSEVLGALSLGFHRDHMVPPEERGLLVSMAHQAAIALRPHPFGRTTSVARGRRPSTRRIACGSSKP